MLKNIAASLGIGDAKVDTVLESDSLYQGETLTGEIRIQGGSVSQQIDKITLLLNTEVKVESDSGVSYQTFCLGKLVANEPFTIGENEHRSIPFDFKLYDETPITELNTRNNKCRVWLETSLDIGFAVDPTDRDYIRVLPLNPVSVILRELECAGYKMVKADVEKGYLNGGNFKTMSGCYQEIEFKSSGFISTKEVELSFLLSNQWIHCLVETDRRFGRGDSYSAFTISKSATSAELTWILNHIIHQ